MKRICIIVFILFSLMPLSVSAEKYAQNSDFTAYINGDSYACVGDADIYENIYLQSTCEIQSAIFEIAYSADLELISIQPIDFRFASINDVYSQNQIKTAVIVAVNSETNTSNTDNDTCPICFNFKILETASVGDATITISKITINSSNNTTFEITHTSPCLIEIKPRSIDSIQIRPRSFAIGYTVYEAVIEPEYAANKDIIWSVDDETVAAITQDGVLYPKQNGSVTISAKSVVYDVNATLRVNVKAYAAAESITSDIGIWNDVFNQYKSMYMIVIDPDDEEMYFTPVYDRGIMQYNGKIMLSGMPFKVVLGDTEVTTLNFVCTGINNVTDRKYVINVVKTHEKIVLDEDPPAIWNGGYYFNFVLNNAPKKTRVYIATYNNQGAMLSIKSIDSADGYGSFKVSIPTFEETTAYKMFLWSGECAMLPVGDVYAGKIYN